MRHTWTAFGPASKDYCVPDDEMDQERWTDGDNGLPDFTLIESDDDVHTNQCSPFRAPDLSEQNVTLTSWDTRYKLRSKSDKKYARLHHPRRAVLLRSCIMYIVL